MCLNHSALLFLRCSEHFILSIEFQCFIFLHHCGQKLHLGSRQETVDLIGHIFCSILINTNDVIVCHDRGQCHPSNLWNLCSFGKDSNCFLLPKWGHLTWEAWKNDFCLVVTCSNFLINSLGEWKDIKKSWVFFSALTASISWRNKPKLAPSTSSLKLQWSELYFGPWQSWNQIKIQIQLCFFTWFKLQGLGIQSFLTYVSSRKCELKNASESGIKSTK